MAVIVEFDTAPVNGSAETQQIAITGTPTSGSIVLLYKGRRVTIPFNATATVVRDAFRAHREIGPTGVNGAGGPLPTTPVTLAFATNLANTNIPQITVDSHTLNAGAVPAVTTTVAGVTGTRGYRKGTQAVALDTGKHYINEGTENVPNWRMVTVV